MNIIELGVVAGCTATICGLGLAGAHAVGSGAGDLGVLLSVWGSQDDPFADLDGDGVVRAEDLGILLVHWGSCGG